MAGRKPRQLLQHQSLLASAHGVLLSGKGQRRRFTPATRMRKALAKRATGQTQQRATHATRRSPRRELAYEQTKSDLGKSGRTLAKPLAGYRRVTAPEPAQHLLDQSASLDRRHHRARSARAGSPTARQHDWLRLRSRAHKGVEIKIVPPLFDFPAGHFEHTQAG